VSPLVILLVLIPASVLGASVGSLLRKYEIRRSILFHNPEREKKVQVWFSKYVAALLIISP
jgi:membrane protein YqaA with SNARE-associated domain